MKHLHHLTRRLFGAPLDAQNNFDGLDEQDLRWVRAAQIDAVTQLIPLSMTINVLNTAIVIYVFWGNRSGALLTAWGSLIAVLAAASFWSWSRLRKNPPKGASARAINRLVLHSAALAFVWGLAPLVLFPDAGLINQLFLGCLTAGMISGGAFALSTVPQAGLAYMWVMVFAAAGSLALAGNRAFAFMTLLLFLYAVYLSRYIVAHGTRFAHHLRDRLKLKAQGEVIGLLLNDFQEHASDWLWETDADDKLTRVSERFARVAEKTRREMDGVPLSDIIGSRREVTGREFADIFGFMADRAAFRDALVPIDVGPNRRFWLLSAKPVVDNAGRFIGYRGVGADVTEKRLAEERVTYLAHYDTVTGLQNRVSFREAVDRALVGVHDQAKITALFFLDLDQFKSVNDTLGHDVGDALLRHVGDRIKACLRAGDIVARLGGDEFAILQSCPDHSTETTHMLARSLIDAFKTPFQLAHGDIVIGTSIGIAIAPIDADETDALMKSADLALYGAKALGTGTYCFFAPYMEADAHRRRALEIGLRSALENGELQVAFQPLVDLRSGKIAGFEALARWNSPVWGAVSPAEFIPVAEATGLIVPIGQWVLREAVTAARGWPAGTTVAVNLSPIQFRNRQLLAAVVGVLADSGLPPQRLELEVTESVFLDGSDQTLGMLNDLRVLGVRIALDDFGTGYSSLGYLRRFPFDKIKIDKSFIDDVATQPESMAIIRAIVALADGLGMSTVAEGVESAVQTDKLRELGCSQIQGYVFSAPVAAAEIAGLFTRTLDDTARGNAALTASRAG